MIVMTNVQKKQNEIMSYMHEISWRRHFHEWLLKHKRKKIKR